MTDQNQMWIAVASIVMNNHISGLSLIENPERKPTLFRSKAMTRREAELHLLFLAQSVASDKWEFRLEPAPSPPVSEPSSSSTTSTCS